MNNRQKQIGFSQRIRLEWLQYTANLVLAGNDKGELNSSLQELLKDKVSVGGKAIRGNKEKVITILMKIWLNVPGELKALRDNGLDLLKSLPRKDQIAVHWGMAMAVYPFWAVVAANTGRLLSLQGTAAAAHIQRRVREQYGQRETVSRATRRVIRSFVDWGIISGAKKNGIYRQGRAYAIDAPKLIAWLIEASLYTHANRSAAIKDLLDSPGIFPFRLMHVSAEQLVSMSPRLDVLRHGLDDDLVMLRKDGIK